MPLNRTMLNALSYRRLTTLSTLCLVTLGALTAMMVAAQPDKVGHALANSPFQKDFATYVSTSGEISFPRDYATRWAHLGSWAVATKPGENISQIHNVYTQPETIAFFNKTGDFPDGAFLVKEVLGAEPHELTTGFASSATTTKIWFVMVRDRKGRFQGNPHWKEGWGWGLYEAKNPSKNISEGFEKSCKTCHLPQRTSNWVYSYGYPTLNHKL